MHPRTQLQIGPHRAKPERARHPSKRLSVPFPSADITASPKCTTTSAAWHSSPSVSLQPLDPFAILFSFLSLSLSLSLLPFFFFFLSSLSLPCPCWPYYHHLYFPPRLTLVGP